MATATKNETVATEETPAPAPVEATTRHRWTEPELTEMVAAVNAAPHGTRKVVFNSFAERYNCSSATVMQKYYGSKSGNRKSTKSVTAEQMASIVSDAITQLESLRDDRIVELEARNQDLEARFAKLQGALS